MKKIIYKEFGITTKITKYRPVAEELVGMKSGKPFVENGKIYINLNKQKNEVQEVSFTDTNGAVLKRDDVQLDTTTYVIGVFYRGNQALIIRRVRPDFTYHVFPGGHVRENESIENTPIREMKEEVGVDISKMKYELVLEQHKHNFGPEKAFFIEVGSDEFHFNKMEPDDPDSVLSFHEISKIKELENPLQHEVIALLQKTILQK